jgi:putative heavy-metal chelation protein
MSDSREAALTIVRQPRDVLEPHAFALEVAERWALERAGRLSADCFRLTSFWYIDYVRQQVPGERKTRYTLRLAQSENYGIAFGPASPLRDTDDALVGEDCREILKNRRFRNDIDRTALIDLVIGHVSAAADHQVILDQTLRDKYALRSRLFADEADIILRRKGFDAIKGSKSRILVIGATAGIIGALVDRGFEVTATDMSPDVVGQKLGGVTVCGETENGRLIKAADLVIITGMTLPNRTLPALIKAAKAHNTSTMIWAITGRNFGHYYTEHGVDCVISDPSPFLLLPGPASIGIWRRKL